MSRVLACSILSDRSIGVAHGLLLLCRRIVLLLLLALLLVGCHGSKLEGVDAALLGHLVAEEGVDHAVAGGLHLGGEGVGGDDEAMRVGC